MSEKRCKSCRFWEESPQAVGHGICQVLGSCISEHITHYDFGCIHWKEKKPDMRMMVAMYLCGLLGEPLPYHKQPNRVKNVYLAYADAIFAIIRGTDDNEENDLADWALNNGFVREDDE